MRRAWTQRLIIFWTTRSSVVRSIYQHRKVSFWQNFKHWFLQTIQTQPRTIQSNGEVFPKNFISNRIDNSRYTVITFIPMVFYNQFKHFLNLYFLVIALMQFYKPLQVGSLTRIPDNLHFAHHHYPDHLLHQRALG